MFLHLGGDAVLPVRDILAMFDLRHRRAGSARDLVARESARGRVTAIGEGPAKTAVLTEGGVFLSPISAATLVRRADGAVDEPDC